MQFGLKIQLMPVKQKFNEKKYKDLSHDCANKVVVRRRSLEWLNCGYQECCHEEHKADNEALRVSQNKKRRMKKINRNH